MNCRFTDKKQCEREYGDCENCRVPNSFGFFWVQKGAKGVWEQRFILNWQRRTRIAVTQDKINRLVSERNELELMPSREEYLKARKG